MIGRLEVLQKLFELSISGEINSLVCALAKGGESDAAVDRSDSFFLDHSVETLRSIAIFGYVEGVGHRVMLGLKTDFDNFHGGYDTNSFCHTSGQTS